MKDEFAPSAGNNKLPKKEEPVTIHEKVQLKAEQLSEELDELIEEKPLNNMLELVDKKSSLFKFTLGQKVRNRHNEDGYIELCGIDYRGVIYLVHLPGNHHSWYTEFELKVIYGNDDQDDPNVKLKSNQKIKTDIPQPKKD
jgi:hypothetical protein